MAKNYIFGGFNSSSTPTNSIYVFDAETNTITALSATLPTAAVFIGASVIGNKIYLFGGWDGSAPMNTINVFDTETETIAQLQATLPTGMYACAVSTFGTTSYLMGGRVTAAGDPPSTDEIVVFDANTGTAITTSSTLPQPLFAPGCGTVANKAYVFGGASSQLGFVQLTTIYKFTATFPLNEGDVYLQTDVFKNKFSLVKSPTEVKTGISAVYVGNANDEAEYCEALLYDADTQTWNDIV